MEICGILINRGADINAENSVGLTPYHLAINGPYNFQNIQICTLLLKASSDISAHISIVLQRDLFARLLNSFLASLPDGLHADILAVHIAGFLAGPPDGLPVVLPVGLPAVLLTDFHAGLPDGLRRFLADRNFFYNQLIEISGNIEEAMDRFGL